MRVALVHDWLNGMRGGERVLEQLLVLCPSATVHTLLFRPEKISEAIKSHPIRTSFIQRLPYAQSRYRWFLPLFPAAIERFDLSGYDLVISNSHCCALGAVVPAGIPNVCYCQTPMRYAWEHFHVYFPPERYNPLTRAAIGWFISRLRKWDYGAAQRVGMFVANSRCVAGRIARHYRRESRIVHPPVDTGYFTPGGARGDFCLVVSALVPYKRVDLAVRVFTDLGLPLVVIGEGPDRSRLERQAGPNVRFLGWQPDEVVRDHYRAARAFVFPGEEDFGITPLEASACGTPAIAYAAGGALETVREGVNGTFFPEQTEASLKRAVEEFVPERFSAGAARAHAEAFGLERFRKEFQAVIDDAVAAARSSARVSAGREAGA